MTRANITIGLMKIATEGLFVEFKDGHLRVEAVLPIYARSESNTRGHWAKKSPRTAEQRGATSLMLSLAKFPMKLVLDAGGVLTITLTRVRPVKQKHNELDDDNLRPSLKAVRDGVADAADRPDNHKQLKWAYAQDVGEDYAVRIDITGEPQ